MTQGGTRPGRTGRELTIIDQEQESSWLPRLTTPAGPRIS
jgi:hypothetical protein